MDKKIIYTNDFRFISDAINEERKANGESTLNDNDIAPLYQSKDKELWDNFRSDFELKFDSKCKYGAVVFAKTNQQVMIIENGVPKDLSNSIDRCNRPFDCLKLLMNNQQLEIDDIDGKLVLIGRNSGREIQGEIFVITQSGYEYLTNNQLSKEFVTMDGMTKSFSFFEEDNVQNKELQ